MVTEALPVPATEAPPGSGREAAAAMSVQQACANGKGYFSEQVCRIRLCQHADNARDAVCIEHRRMEEQQRRNDAP
jgi:hypothetical protein